MSWEIEAENMLKNMSCFLEVFAVAAATVFFFFIIIICWDFEISLRYINVTHRPEFIVAEMFEHSKAGSERGYILHCHCVSEIWFSFELWNFIVLFAFIEYRSIGRHLLSYIEMGITNTIEAILSIACDPSEHTWSNGKMCKVSNKEPFRHNTLRLIFIWFRFKRKMQ